MLVGDGGGHEGDHQDDDTGDTEQDDAEVKVVDSADDGGTVTGIGAAAGSVNELGDHPGQADGQPDHQAVKSALKEREEGQKTEKRSTVWRVNGLKAALDLLARDLCSISSSFCCARYVWRKNSPAQ